MTALAGRGEGEATEGVRRLRTVVCTCGGLYGALVLRRLRACDRLEICAVVRSTRVFHPGFGFLRGAVAQLRCSGVAYALYLWCTTTLADWLCAIGGVGAVPRRSTAPGVRVLTTRNLNDVEGLRFLSSCTPDLLVSAFFNQRVHAAVLGLPPYGCLNIHPSLLPDAKGVDPVFQAMLRDAPQLGVTVHFMSAGLDEGPTVAQQSIERRPGSSVFATTSLLYREGAELLASAIESIIRGTAGTAQHGAGSYQSWPTRHEILELRARGGSLLNMADLARLVFRGRSLLE